MSGMASAIDGSPLAIRERFDAGGVFQFPCARQSFRSVKRNQLSRHLSDAVHVYWVALHRILIQLTNNTPVSF